MNLNEQIWREDVQDQLEVTESLWKVAYNHIERLKYQFQFVPEEAKPVVAQLIVEMTEINNHLAEVTKRYEKVKESFPPEPRPMSATR